MVNLPAFETRVSRKVHSVVPGQLPLAGDAFFPARIPAQGRPVPALFSWVRGIVKTIQSQSCYRYTNPQTWLAAPSIGQLVRRALTTGILPRPAAIVYGFSPTFDMARSLQQLVDPAHERNM